MLAAFVAIMLSTSIHFHLDGCSRPAECQEER
jgi:hypothetical protein